MLSDLAPAVSGTFFNGGPTLFTRKPMLLLVCHLLQHGLGLLTLGALKFANPVIVFWHRNMCIMLCKYFKPSFYISFLKSNIKN